MMKRFFAAAVVAITALVPSLTAQQAPAARHEVAAADDTPASATSHTMRLGGQDIAYTATAGTIPIRSVGGDVAARMFFVAYTRDDADPATRPVSFLFNGGPGSASVWLHMGSFAPRVVKMADEGFQPAPPYQLVDNPNSLIDESDLVFVDAIDTGYSRATAGTDNAQFHGQDGDITAFGDFIAGYLKAYNRWPRTEWRRAVVCAVDVPDVVPGTEQRHRLGGADPDLCGDGVVSQEARP